MTTRMFSLAVLFASVVLVTAQAQQPAKDPPSKGGPGQTAPKAENAAEPMAEEIEIMRRLLDRTLEKQQHGQIVGTPLTNFPPYTTSPYGSSTYPQTPSLIPYLGPDSQGRFLQSYPYQYNSSSSYIYPWNPNTTYNPAQWSGTVSAPHAPLELRSAQGVYLKGYGVVYTATLALPTAPPVADTKKAEPKPLTEWERTRQELHGEKAEPAKTTPQDTLADAVLKVLAKNGQHFSQLAETEQITVALTLPRAPSCTQCHIKEKSAPITTSTSGSSGGGTPTGSSSTKVDDAALKAVMEKVNPVKKDAEKAALLGDLHVKQGKNEQAAASFQEALKLYLDAAETLRRGGLDVKGTPIKDAQLEQDLVATAAKAVQALTAQGKLEEAKAALKLLDQHLQKTSPTETPSKTPETPAKVELPAKLVISAPKKLLDLVGADKITFEEFRKNATVEYQPARTIEKQPAKP